MRRRLFIVLLVLAGFTRLVGSTEEFVCTEEGGGGGVPIPNAKAYIVFVAYPPPMYPENPDSLLPLAAENGSIVNGIIDYYNEVSYGQHSLDLTVLRRLDDPSKAWMLPQAPDQDFDCPPPVDGQCLFPCELVGGNCEWPDTYHGLPGLATKDVMKRIYSHYGAGPIWEDVDFLFIVHYACIPNRWGRQADPCGPSGFRGFGRGFVTDPVWNFSGTGTTQMLLPTDVELLTTDAPRIRNIILHEHGHIVMGHHSVMSGNPPGFFPDEPPPDNIPFGPCLGPNGNWKYVPMGYYDRLRGIEPATPVSWGGHPDASASRRERWLATGQHDHHGRSGFSYSKFPRSKPEGLLC